MKTFFSLALLIATVAVTSALFFGDSPHWDGLEVTWSLNPFKGYNTQPRTRQEALKKGFLPVGHHWNKCNESAPYQGIAMVKDGDYSLTLLYDVNGYIAGMQGGIPNQQQLKEGYPSALITPPFVEDGSDSSRRQTLTVYFTDPKKICTTGRTEEEFESQGTGTGLWIQNGPTIDDVIEVPMNEADVSAPWVEGKCFYTMGKHYWYNLSVDMDCDTFFPMFLLYNKGQLNGLGWAFGAPFESPNYEHPTPNRLELFIKEVPKCLMSRSGLSTMHIFLTKRARISNRC